MRKILSNLRNKATRVDDIIREIQRVSEINAISDSEIKNQLTLDSRSQDRIEGRVVALEEILSRNCRSQDGIERRLIAFEDIFNRISNSIDDLGENQNSSRATISETTAEIAMIKKNLAKIEKIYRHSIGTDDARIKPIRVHFFFQVPEVWTTWETVWSACCEHPEIEATLVLLPFHHDSNDNPGRGRRFLVERGLRFIDQCVYDIYTQQPDIVILQNPYDSTRPSDFGVDRLMANGIRVVYIPYGLDVGGGQENIRWQYDLNVQRNAWRIFVRSNEHFRMFGLHCQAGNNHVFVTGHPKIDKVVRDCTNSDDGCCGDTSDAPKTLLWCPHFSIEPGGWSTFDQLADPILKYFESMPKDCKLLVRPHPLFFGRIRERRSESDADSLRRRLHQPPFIELDDHEQYGESFRISDALMADAGSFLLEYLPTGKPILYLNNIDGPGLNESAAFIDKYYQATNFEHVKDFIEMVCEGIDPRREERFELIDTLLFGADGHAGARIVAEMVRSYKKEEYSVAAI